MLEVIITYVQIFYNVLFILWYNGLLYLIWILHIKAFFSVLDLLIVFEFVALERKITGELIEEQKININIRRHNFDHLNIIYI